MIGSQQAIGLFYGVFIQPSRMTVGWTINVVLIRVGIAIYVTLTNP